MAVEKMTEEQIRDALDNHDQRISDNTENAGSLSAAVNDLKARIDATLAQIIASCNTALINADRLAENYKTGKPEGYDELVETINTVKRVQDIMVVPFLSDLQISNFNEEKWSAFVEKLDSVKTTAERVRYPSIYLLPINLGIVNPSSGKAIAKQVKNGVSLVEMIYSNDVVSLELKGWWSQGNGWGSGVLLDSNGNAFLVTAEGEDMTVTLMEGKAVAQTDLISEEERSYVRDLVKSGVTVEQIKQIVNKTGTSTGSDSSSSVAFVNVGVVSAETGGEEILEKTSNGLQVLKMTLGGVTIVGPWTRENTFGYGLLTDIEGNVYSVRVQDDKIFSNKLDTGEGLVERNNVSADLDQIVSMIKDLGKTADDINNPRGRVADIEKQMKIFEETFGPVMEDANKTFAKQDDLVSLITAMGTTDKVNGKSMLQLVLEILSDITDLKNATGLDTGTSTVVDDEALFSYEKESVSKDHEALLRIIRSMARNCTPEMTGDTLITQGLISTTTKSLPNWKAGFISDATAADDVDIFLKSFCVDLTNQDTGSILGYDAGSGVVYKPDDVILKDKKTEMYYPTVDYTFENEQLKDGSYTMRVAEADGLRIFVQPPAELSEGKQDAMTKVVWWYVPSSLKLIEKATSLSFNSPTSKLSRIRLKTEDGFVTFDKKGLVIVYDVWDKGIMVNTPGAGVMATTSFTAVNADTKKGTAVVLDINGNYYSVITEDRGVGTTGATQTLDRVICHQLVSAVLGVNISNYDTLPLWFKEGMACLVHGADDITSVDIRELLKDEYRLVKALTVDSKESYTAAENSNDPAAAGYLFLRYLFNSIGQTNMEGVTETDKMLSQGARNIKIMISSMAGSRLTNPDIILDNGVKAIGSRYRAVGAVKADFLTDLQRSVNRHESYTTFLENSCGIVLFNEDDGSIYGYDAGGEKIVTAEDIVWEDGGEMLSYPANSLHLGDYKACYRYFDNTLFLFPDRDKITEDEQYVLALVATHHIPAAMGMIKTLTGLSFSKALTKGKIMGPNHTVQTYDTPFVFVTLDSNNASPFVLEENTPVRCDWIKNTETLKADIVNLTINSEYFTDIDRDNLNGKSAKHPDTPYLDILILRELLKGAMACNLAGDKYPLWFIEGLSLLISGADKETTEKFAALLSDVKRVENALDPDITEFTDATDPGVAGYAFLRYLAKQTSA